MFRRLKTGPQLFIAALGVSPIRDDHRALKTIFARSRWKWDGVPSIEKARSWMARRGPPSIVICERDLPDGSWKQLFQETQVLLRPPKFIVSSRLADEYLWVEVLNLGGHNVLSTPFDAREVSFVVRYAAESWQQQPESTSEHPKVAGAGIAAGPPGCVRLHRREPSKSERTGD
jgi:DNA-binding response OmpR family regulator